MNPPATEIDLLYDGACPLCKREINFLSRRNGEGRVGFVDITADDFDAARYGLTLRDVHAQMHGILPDGSIVRGMEVFRRAYRALGIGWVMAPTGWPILRPIFDMLYRGFAKVRPRLQRRNCEDDRCAV